MTPLFQSLGQKEQRNLREKVTTVDSTIDNIDEILQNTVSTAKTMTEAAIAVITEDNTKPEAIIINTIVATMIAVDVTTTIAAIKITEDVVRTLSGNRDHATTLVTPSF